MGSVPNCRKDIPVHHAIRWFKCKLKPPKNCSLKPDFMVTDLTEIWKVHKDQCQIEPGNKILGCEFFPGGSLGTSVCKGVNVRLQKGENRYIIRKRVLGHKH